MYVFGQLLLLLLPDTAHLGLQGEQHTVAEGAVQQRVGGRVTCMHKQYSMARVSIRNEPKQKTRAETAPTSHCVGT
jgi:hypothetical protein